MKINVEVEDAYKRGYKKGYADGKAARKKDDKIKIHEPKPITQEAVDALRKMGLKVHEMKLDMKGKEK